MNMHSKQEANVRQTELETMSSQGGRGGGSNMANNTIPVPMEFMTRILRENWQLRGALIETQEQIYQIAERAGQHEETVKNLATNIQERVAEAANSA